MSLLDGILDKMQLNADYEDDEFDMYEDEYEDEGLGESLIGKLFGDREKKNEEEPVKEVKEKVEKKVVKNEPRREQSGFWSVKGSKNRVVGSHEVCVIAPKNFSEVSEIVDTLLSSKVVLLNIEGISLDEAQRITDFVFGAVYAIGGSNFQISSNIFVCAPSGNDIYDGVKNEDKYSTDLSELRKVN